MRRRVPGRGRCPGRKKAENGHPNQEAKEPYTLENLHKEHSLHQAVALRLITSPAAHGRLIAEDGSGFRWIFRQMQFRHTHKAMSLAVRTVNERKSLLVQDNTEKGLVDFDFAVVFDEA